MNNVEIRMKRNIEILRIKQQEIQNAKMAKNRDTVWSDTERYKLNMEMLTWIVNTDSLLFKFSKDHWGDKDKFKKSNGADGNKIQGILLGLYYAFNCFKHNLKILSMEKTNYISLFEIEDTKYIIASTEWSESSELLNLKDEYYPFYADYLEGESVHEVFEKAVSFLVEQSKKRGSVNGKSQDRKVENLRS